MRQALRIAFASDIHLGHRKNVAQDIIANLDTHITNDAVFGQIDMLILAGDVFDEALALSSEHVQHIDAWVGRVILLADKHNVVVRVLEGTPSHDRGQSERFTIVANLLAACGVRVDLKYVNTLSVEHFDHWDMDVLYVPDEWNHSTQQTLTEVRELLAARGLQQVDVAVMHGSMDFQLPAHVKDIPRHDSVVYSALVRGFITIGHIHLYSTQGNIIAQGSFDRLAHNEEAPKGFVIAQLQPSGAYTMQFVQNTGARKYVTHRCLHEEMEENLRELDKVAASLPPNSCLRVESHHANPIQKNVDVLSRRWPLLVWSALATGKEEEAARKRPAGEEFVYVPVSVRPDNIRALVLERLSKHNLESEVLALCTATLQELERI